MRDHSSFSPGCFLHSATFQDQKLFLNDEWLSLKSKAKGTKKRKKIKPLGASLLRKSRCSVWEYCQHSSVWKYKQRQRDFNHHIVQKQFKVSKGCVSVISFARCNRERCHQWESRLLLLFNLHLFSYSGHCKVWRQILKNKNKTGILFCHQKWWEP